MSWNQWLSGAVNPGTSNTVGASLNSQIPFNPNVMPPTNYPPPQYSAMSTEQQYAMQQNWQQWQSYQQQYAQWHAQYGEQYKREMEGKLGTIAPPVPYVPNAQISPVPSQYMSNQVLPNYFGAPPPPPETDNRNSNHNLFSQPPPPPPPLDNMSNNNKKQISSKQLQGKSSFVTQFTQNNVTNDRFVGKNQNTPQSYSKPQASQSSNNKFETIQTQNMNLPTEVKTREEQIFDEQFQKWEEEFENWKRANINHPDKKAYREYEMKFEDCRKKLIERRTQMRRKKQMEMMSKNENEKNIDEKKNREKEMNENVDIKISDSQNKEFLETHPAKSESGIPGLDLIQKTKTTENVTNIETSETTEIIDLESPKNVSSPKENWLQNENEENENENNDNYIDKLRNTINEEEKSEKSHVSDSSDNKMQMIPTKKIPSLLDQIIEKPIFSPQREQSASQFSRFDNFDSSSINSANIDVNKIENQLPLSSTTSELCQQKITPLQNDPNIQNLASALSNPNVMALLNAALKTNDNGSNVKVNSAHESSGVQDTNRNNNFNMDRFKNFNENKRFENQESHRNNSNFNSERFGNFNEDNRFPMNRDIWNKDVWQNQNTNNNFRSNQSNDWNNFQRGGGRGDGNNYENPWNRNNFRDLSRGGYMNRNDDDNNDNSSNRNNKRNNRNKNNRNSVGLNNNSNSSSFSQDLDRFNHNPFKSNSPKLKPPITDEDDYYFRPKQIIDYQNKSLPEKIIDTNDDTKQENITPKKIVDYGHKSSCSFNANHTALNLERDEFIPMKTFDYEHSSSKNDGKSLQQTAQQIPQQKQQQQPPKRQSFGEFLANHSSSLLKRKSTTNNDDNYFGFEKKYIEENKSSHPVSQWSSENIEKSNISSTIPTELADELKNKINDGNKNDDRTETIEQSNAVVENFGDFEQNSYSEDFPKEEETCTSKQTFNIFPLNKNYNENQLLTNKIFPSFNKTNSISIDVILLKPGRYYRPKKICIILRGPPGSGKSYIAKLIKEKETELNGGSAPRLLSIDDYFVVENDKEEICPKTGKKIKTKQIEYVYESEMEPIYTEYLIKSFKKTLSENLYNFIIVDCGNYFLKTFTEFYNCARSEDYMAYTIDLCCDVDKCFRQNIHNRSIEDIKNILKNWTNTPEQYVKLDITNLLENKNINDDNDNENPKIEENISLSKSLIEISDSDDSQESSVQRSKWDVDQSATNLDRLDGVKKQSQAKSTIEDYLQADGWEPPPSNSNKKRVRWADIEEKREQDKMRAIGFVVGQTDWNRMMDPTSGKSALTKTKYIEKIQKHMK